MTTVVRWYFSAPSRECAEQVQASEGFPSTLVAGTGWWDGAGEPCYVLEHITNDDAWLDGGCPEEVARRIAVFCDQQEVLVTIHQAEVLSVRRS